MKKPTILHRTLGILLLPVLIVCLALPAAPARAQDEGYPGSPGTYGREELAQMLAPIALYPDALLSQILMASTYPIEVIEADRWVRRNPGLKDQAMDAALLGQDWDPSVKSICHFPSILALMSERIGETTDLGNAFLAQEGEVMQMIQELRAQAYAQGHLASDFRQNVVVERETIVIVPANPRVVYVPYYDPLYVYGPWWYPAYPPYYWGPPGVYVGVGIFYWPGFYFSFTFGNWCYFDWHRHYIYIDVHRRPRYVRHDRWLAKPGPWHHAPDHRRGVAYRERATARKFGQAPARATDFRRDIRGFPERGGLVREREVRVDERRRTERNRAVDGATIDRDRRQQKGVEQDRQQQRLEKDRQQQRVEQDRQRQRVEQERKLQRAEQETRQRQQAERNRQQPQTIDRQKEQRQQADRDRQVPQRTIQKKQVQERVKSEAQQKVRDNVFNRIEEGRSERDSSERGRVSRQGHEASAPGRSRSRDDNQSGRFDRGSKQR